MKRIPLMAVIFIITVAFVTNSFAGGRCAQYSLNELAKKSVRRLKKLDKKIAKMEKGERAVSDLDGMNDLYMRAEALCNQGKYDEAKFIYLQVKEFAEDRTIKAAIRQRKKELRRLAKQERREEIAVRRRQEQLERQKKIEAQTARRAEQTLERQKKVKARTARRVKQARQRELARQRKNEEWATRKAENTRKVTVRRQRKARERAARKKERERKKAARKEERERKKAARRAEREGKGALIKF
ncbi:MAG: hypothetical protein JSV93_02115 [Candidatus Omnitrophota bacterium]|nr:MAG: hypothetical protein JSV93_02115 [Candidatus Omnitrophota bacterium]